jgi:hypothetical protein
LFLASRLPVVQSSRVLSDSNFGKKGKADEAQGYSGASSNWGEFAVLKHLALALIGHLATLGGSSHISRWPQFGPIGANKSAVMHMLSSSPHAFDTKLCMWLAHSCAISLNYDSHCDVEHYSSSSHRARLLWSSPNFRSP